MKYLIIVLAIFLASCGGNGDSTGVEECFTHDGKRLCCTTYCDKDGKNCTTYC